MKTIERYYMKKFIIEGEVTLPFKYILSATNDDEAEDMADRLTFEDVQEAILKSKAEIYIDTVDEGTTEDLIGAVISEIKGA